MISLIVSNLTNATVAITRADGLFRAIVSDYSSDTEVYEIDDEYIFCDELIVAPIASGETKRKVYLPKGK